jgi:hypothetical protein
MRKHLTKVMLTGGAAALTVALTATAALATTASTWSVKPGGAIKVSGTAQVKDSKTGTVAKCKSITLSGTLKKGKGLSGTGLGTATKGSFSGCTIATISVKVAVKNLPWAVDALSYNKSKGVTTGKLAGVELVATAPGCSATLQGTSATNGFTDFTYSNKTGKLTLVSSGGNLRDEKVSGCFGLVKNGDPEKASGSTTLSPKQTITSP